MSYKQNFASHQKENESPHSLDALLKETGNLALLQVGDDLLGGVMRRHQLDGVDEAVQFLKIETNN